MNNQVTVKVKVVGSAFADLIDAVDAEIVNIPKFLEAYPFLARFPTRMAGSDLSVPAICEIAQFNKDYRSQLLRSWFINFGSKTINGKATTDSVINNLLLETLNYLGCGDVKNFRVDPNDEDFHLIRQITLADGKGKAHLLIGSNRSNGALLKVTIIRPVADRAGE